MTANRGRPVPEAVNRHDHRYDFETYVVAGATQNIWFKENEQGGVYNKFSCLTTLNGLYSMFTADRALDKLRLFRECTGYRLETA